jgi:hypothetical protein
LGEREQVLSSFEGRGLAGLQEDKEVKDLPLHGFRRGLNLLDIRLSSHVWFPPLINSMLALFYQFDPLAGRAYCRGMRTWRQALPVLVSSRFRLIESGELCLRANSGRKIPSALASAFAHNPPTLARVLSAAVNAIEASHVEAEVNCGWGDVHPSLAASITSQTEGGLGKGSFKSLEQEDFHQRGPRCSWVRNQRGNVSSIESFN